MVSAERASSTYYDIIVVGSGVLGTALSISLARSGRKVLVVERDLSPPHARIVGELLQPGGCVSLDKLGLLDALEGIDAVPCQGYMVIQSRERSVRTPYPANDGKRVVNARNADAWNSSELFEGRSFHHGRFVGSLRERLVGQKNLDVLEGTVNDLIECGTTGNKVIGIRVTPKNSDGTKIEVLSPLTIIADGYASKFRKIVNPSAPAPLTRSYFVGIELEHCKLPAPHHGHVILPSSAPNGNKADARIGPILLYALSPTTVRMLVDVSTQKTPSKDFLRDKIAPVLPESVVPSFLDALADDSPNHPGGQKVKSMPNSFLPPSVQGKLRDSKEGVLLAGDAMNMRHPLTGGGMSVALNDAVILTELLGGGSRRRASPRVSLNGHANGNGQANGNGLADSEEKDQSDSDDDSSLASSISLDDREVCNIEDWWEVRNRLEEWHWRRKGVGTCVNVLAMALYTLFGAEDENLDVLRKGCFEYFLLGGQCIEGPVSMLSALNPSPPLLLYHFFSVALYSIYLLFTAPRLPKGQTEGKPTRPTVLDYPALTVQSVLVFWTACRVILPVLWSEVDF